VRAREIDDDGVGGRLERSRPLVPETEEEDVGPGRRSLRVRDERRQRIVEAGVERGRGRARERVGAERDHLEPGMPEHAVERLLPGVARRTEDRHTDHQGIIRKKMHKMHQ